jgi:ADP-ribosyl-[dinitrogen reductase] hydrolase
VNEYELDFNTLGRAVGVVLGGAVGDALGAGYEMGEGPVPEEVTMLSGTLTGQPAGYWTDDTAMSVAVLETAAHYGTLITPEALESLGDRFLDWFGSEPADIGNQTRAVLSAAKRGGELALVARDVQAANPTLAGNGGLMRTGPVALAHLGDTSSLILAARSVSALTHPGERSQEACVLWTLAIDHAVRTGELAGPRVGLSALEPEAQEFWTSMLDAAETGDPRRFTGNGYVVTALQAAWAAIYATKDEPEHFEAALRCAVSIGDDTDTVAAIAGSLLGGVYGVNAIGFAWRHGLAGWPEGYRGLDLTNLAALAARRGQPDPVGWPTIGSMRAQYAQYSPSKAITSFEADPEVRFGDIESLSEVSSDAYLSLCRIGTQDRRAPDHEVVWMLDNAENENIAQVLADTADAVAYLRERGQSVFVHCVKAESRTPTVAMTWLIRHHGYSFAQARETVLGAMASANPHPALLAGVAEVAGWGRAAPKISASRSWE